jgi:alpha-beta hydrolase superfamily lysophospholipase
MSSVLSNRRSSAAERNPTVNQKSMSLAGPRNAIYFDSGESKLFGWLQIPADCTTSSVGLVICKPYGYEAVCAHRGMRAFEDAAASLGLPTLQFDYLGTGDSAEIDPEADQLAAWTQDVISAVQELRRRTGVQQVCLLGVRLGALLAVLAASQCAAVTSLILIAPIISGRRYVRGLRTARLAAQSLSGVSADAAEANAGSMEASGFLFSAVTLSALAQIDLQAHAVLTVPDMLVIDGASLPGAGQWAQQLGGSGVRAKYLALPGLIEMIMTAPQFAAVPLEMVGAVHEWLRHFLSASAASAAHAASTTRREAGQSPPASMALVLRNGGPEEPGTLTERPVFFGAEGVLFGIVTEPRTDEIRRRAVILLNAGSDYHIGANRMHVTLARDWASRGYVSLRMDLAGLGDSGTRSGQADNEVFPPAALDDIRAGIDLLRDRYGAADVTLFGLCSGAYHALRAAVAGLPINRILMVNPQNYFWDEGTTLTDLQPAEVIHNPGLYRRRVFSGVHWKRLLAGEVNVWRIAKIYFYRPLLALESTLRDIARRLGIRLPNDLGSELVEISKRGVKIVFVFARGEPGIDLLHLEGGSSVKRLGDSCRIRIVDGGDHVFSQSGARGKMSQIISDELFSKI